MKLDTLLVKGVNARENPHKAVVPPVFLATTFVQDGLSEFQKFGYSRGANPTRDAFEELFAKFEGAKHAFALASGMAATAAVFNLLKSGDKVLLNNNVYGGTYRYAKEIFAAQGIKFELVDDLNEVARLDEDVKMVFVETPSNPLLRVTDIARIAALAHENGALVVADNTFLTPYYQLCLQLGADVVVYSATKYIAGHSDVIAGVVATNDDALAERLNFMKNTLGAVLAPMEAYNLIKGLKTLAVRFERQSENTLKIIDFLRANDAIEAVHFAGSHSPNEARIQAAQASGIGAVISAQLAKGYDGDKFLKNLKIFDLAVSLGGVESLICHPASMTHDAFGKELAARIGITQNLLRIAVGIEDAQDLIEDLDQAIKAAKI